MVNPSHIKTRSRCRLAPECCASASLESDFSPPFRRKALEALVTAQPSTYQVTSLATHGNLRIAAIPYRPGKGFGQFICSFDQFTGIQVTTCQYATRGSKLRTAPPPAIWTNIALCCHDQAGFLALAELNVASMWWVSRYSLISVISPSSATKTMQYKNSNSAPPLSLPTPRNSIQDRFDSDV